MTTVKTIHQNMEIIFDEQSNIWKCADLGLSSRDLTILRKAIDQHRPENIRLYTLPVLLLEDDYWESAPIILEAIVLLVRESAQKADVQLTKGRTIGRFSYGAGDIIPVDMSSLYPLETRSDLEAYIAAKTAAKAAEAVREAAAEKLLGQNLTPRKIREATVRQAEDAA
jgi:hypothetical protein